MKGNTWALLDKSEGGYFGKVLMLHYAVPKSRIVRLRRDNTIYEVGGRPRVFWYFVSLIVGLYLCLRYKVTVIRANDPFLSGVLGLILSFFCHKPFCVSIHSDYDFSYTEVGIKPVPPISLNTANLLARFTLRFADKVLVVNESLVGYAIKHHTQRRRIRVIPHGIDATLFVRPPDLALKISMGLQNKHLVAVVARLSAEKYTTDLYSLAKNMTGDDIVFVVMGDGDERMRLDQLPNVRCLGFVDNGTVARVLSFCDVGICLRDGYSLIEMSMAGLPIVAYDVDWHREIVSTGKGGILVRLGDTENLSEKVKWLVEHSKAAKQIGDNGRRRALAHHSLDITRKIKMRCYDEVIAGKC